MKRAFEITILWDIEIVDWVAEWTSLALDNNGYPAISYGGGILTGLKYARWNGSSWDIEIVDSIVGSIFRTPLALDSNSYPAISYCDLVKGDLKFARWSGSAWNIEVLDSEGTVGWSNSLVLDSYGYPAISYRDLTNWDLKFARYIPPTAVFRGCVDTAAVGWSLAKLPLTDINDDEDPPFPILTSIPGQVLDENVPCLADADLLLYRVLEEGAPAGNILRAAKQAGATLLTF